MMKTERAQHPHLLPGKLIDWRDALARHYKRLGRTSRLRRFMTNMPNKSLQAIAERASPTIVLAVEAEGRVIGVLEVFKGKDDHAEIAISVEDAFQGQGFGRELFLDGLAAAERIGVRTADLYFASENHGIRSLVGQSGGLILQRGAECEAHIDLAQCQSRKAAAPAARQSRTFGSAG